MGTVLWMNSLLGVGVATSTSGERTPMALTKV